MSLKSEIDLERTSLGILATEQEHISDLFLLVTIGSVEDLSRVVNLSQQLNSGLSVISIWSLHVKIVHEVHQNFGSQTSLDFFGLVNELKLEINLHIWGGGVGVKVDIGKRNGIWISSVQEILNDDGLTGTGVTDEKHWFSSADVVGAELLESTGLDGMDQDLGVNEIFIFWMLIWDNEVIPSLPVVNFGVVVVVEDSGAFIVGESGLTLM